MEHLEEKKLIRAETRLIVTAKVGRVESKMGKGVQK